MNFFKSIFFKKNNFTFRSTKIKSSSFPKKKIYIFLHVAKSGGSSFWHSLVNSINQTDKNRRFAIDDSYHKAMKEYSKVNTYSQHEAITRILKDFIPSEHENLIFHYHAYGENLDNLFPRDMKPTYILLFRSSIPFIFQSQDFIYIYFIMTIIISN